MAGRRPCRLVGIQRRGNGFPGTARRFRYLCPALPPAEGVVEAAATEKFTPVPAHPADMVPRRDAIRNHVLIFAGSVVATLFLAEKIVR